jgi:hypothetical protein
MKEVWVVQMFVRFTARRVGLHGLTLATVLLARPAQAASFQDVVDKVQGMAGQAVDRGFEYAVWLMDQATDLAGRFNEWAMVMLDRVGMDTHQAALIGGSVLIALVGFWLLPRGPKGGAEEGGQASTLLIANAGGKKGKCQAWRLRDAVDAMKAEMVRDEPATPVNVE